MQTRRIGATLGAAALLVGLAACGSEDGGSSADREVTLGIVPSWTDHVNAAYLWKNVLESKGYTVSITELADMAPLYAGLAQGDVDVFPSAWSEVTHKDYMNQYGDRFADWGVYYGNARLTIAVPQYSRFHSIEDLKGNASVVNGRIVGIEAGAGLTRITKEQVIPQYDLGSEYTLLESSTTAMLAELKNAIEANREIVVTLWRPYWANQEFAVRDLDDPKGALGQPEGIHILANKQWAENHQDLKPLFESLKLTDEQYGTLENKVVNEFGQGKEAQAVESWLQENPDISQQLKG